MKKRITGWIILFCVLLCAVFAAAEEGVSPPEGKTEAESNFSVENLAGVYLCNIASITPWPSSVGSEIINASLTGEQGNEPVTAARLTMISGGEKMAEAIGAESPEEGKVRISYDLFSLQETGSAVYRLEMESEHYWYSGEFTADFVDTKKISVNLLQYEIPVPLGWEIPISDLFNASVLETEPSGMIRGLLLQTRSNTNGSEPEDFVYDYESFLGKKEGAYKFTLTAAVGNNGVEFNRIVTLKVDSALGEQWDKAAEEARAQKTEGRPNCDLSGDYLCGYEGFTEFTPAFSSRHVTLSPKGEEMTSENREPLIWSRVTLLSGDPELAEMFRIDHSSLSFEALAGIQKEAGASFLVELESEHYQYVEEISVRTVSAKNFSLSYDFDTVSVPAEKELYLDSCVDYSAFRCVPETHISFIRPFPPEPVEGTYDSEGYSLSGVQVTTRKPGDYPAVMGVKVFRNEIYVRLPFTLHVQTPEETEANERKAMENAPQEDSGGDAVPPSGNPQASSLIPIDGLLGQGEFTGKEKVNAVCYNLDRFPDGWIYAPSTFPEGIHASHVETSLVINSSNSSESVTPEIFSVEYLSGDEFLRGALYFRTFHDNQTGDRLYLAVNNDVLSAPGSAVYRIRLKSGSLYFETELPLWVLSWEEHPLFTVRPIDGPIHVELAEGETEGYSDEQLAASYFTSHFRELSAAYPLSPASFASERHMLYLDGNADGEKLEKVYDNEGNASWMFRRAGSYPFLCLVNLGNVHYRADVTYVALPYAILGSSTPTPGDTVTYRVKDAEPEAGRSFAWRFEGEGLLFDEDTGVLTLPGDVPEGTAFTVTAVPSDGGMPVSLQGIVYRGVLGGRELERVEPMHGFTLPVISGPDFAMQRDETRIWCAPVSPEGSSVLKLTTFYYSMDMFYENPADAADLYDRNALPPEIFTVLEQEDVTVDGHPVRLVIGRSVEGSEAAFSVGAIYYVRNYNMIISFLECDDLSGTGWESIPKVTLSDLHRLLEEMSYDESTNYFKFSDGALTLTAEGDVKVLYGGGKLLMTATFGNTNRVNKKTGIDGLEWSVVDAETKEPVSGVSVDQKGVVTVDKKLDHPLQVQVRVFSTVFRTEAIWPLSVYPAITGIEVKPAEVFFYTGTDAEETLTPVLTPDTIPTAGLTWKINQEKVASLTPGENGTAVVCPLAAGKARAEVSAPDGKKAAVSITVTAPVSSLTLSTKGRSRPGGTVTVIAKLEPKNAGNKNLEWSLNVDETIATINGKGQVKISKEASPGTMILVTCKALGAPEPVTATLEIPVEE